MWGTTELNVYMMQFLYHGVDTLVSYKPADRSKATADYNHGQYQRMLDTLEARLTGRDYILGASFSLADIPAASALLVGLDLGGSVEGRKNMRPGWNAAAPARRSRGSAARGRRSRPLVQNSEVAIVNE